MGEYISRRAVIDALRAWDQGKAYLPIEFRELIEGLPSAIVQCENCTNWQTDWDPKTAPGTHYCATMDSCMKAEDYCSYGERKDNE